MDLIKDMTRAMSEDIFCTHHRREVEAVGETGINRGMVIPLYDHQWIPPDTYQGQYYRTVIYACHPLDTEQ